MLQETPRFQCLQLTKFYPPYNGGIETTARDIAVGLAQRAWAVDVLCSNNKNVTVSEMVGGIPIFRVASMGQVASAPMAPGIIMQLARRSKWYDIIHVHMPNPMANLGLMLSFPTARIVVHWHSDIVKQQQLLKLYTPIQYWLLKRADIIIVSSRAYADSSKWLKPFLNKVRIIPSGINEPQFEMKMETHIKHVAEIKAQFGSRKLVFSLGRMTYYKGFDILIKAAKFFDDKTVVIIGGEGELLNTLQELASDLKVADKVHFLGAVSNAMLPAYYEAADVFCLPSLMRSEAFGLVMIEAMSYGRPIVATNILGSGVPWVNIHGQTGLNVEPGDPQDLAQAIQSLLQNPDRAHALGQNGRQRFLRFFTADIMVDAIDDIYKELLLHQ
jgi:glycosyltransferase involved in cell wall biosynthesis